MQHAACVGRGLVRDSRTRLAELRFVCFHWNFESLILNFEILIRNFDGLFWNFDNTKWNFGSRLSGILVACFGNLTA